MALLGWVPATGADAAGHLPDVAQPRFVHNASGRFESRWVMVRVDEGSPAVMLKVRLACAALCCAVLHALPNWLPCCAVRAGWHRKCGIDGALALPRRASRSCGGASSSRRGASSRAVG